MLEISSSNNPLIKEIKGLNKKRNRWKSKLFIIEGVKIVEEAINSEIKIRKILFSNSFLESKEGLIFYENVKNTYDTLRLKDNLFKDLSDTENPQGIMALCEFHLRDLTEIGALDNPSILFLDAIQDPGNLGTIIRSADAFDIDGIILGEGCVDPYNLKVVRSTMGSILRLPLYIRDDSLETLMTLKQDGFEIMVTSLDGSPIYDIDFKKKFVAVIGNEAKGVNPKILDLADKYIKIPMPGKAESLNAGVAASILMYETMRNR
ncbi:MAG: TrmH family RNA methyltransferase [Tissierellaceae bacterium]|jgi:TrmH family RNA methyltransferase|nr:RNA methyltransferase [Tissierellia bacterium]